MDIYQLRTFVTVAREGSITRTSELLHLSQPAVSAHIKSIEDTLGLSLFDRTPRGMVLTSDGERLLAKAEQTLAVHQELLEEATRIKGQLTGKLRLGAGSNTDNAAVGRLITVLAERYPEVEVGLKHGTSAETLAGLRNGSLDAGFYNEAGEPDSDLSASEVSRFSIHLVAPRSSSVATNPPDWSALSSLPWIYPTASACCGRTAERLFQSHQFRPKRIISVDREVMTRTLVAGGIGIGLLHEQTARTAEEAAEVRLVYEAPQPIRVLFAHLRSRSHDPLLAAVDAIVRGGSAQLRPHAGG